MESGPGLAISISRRPSLFSETISKLTSVQFLNVYVETTFLWPLGADPFQPDEMSVHPREYTFCYARHFVQMFPELFRDKPLKFTETQLQILCNWVRTTIDDSDSLRFYSTQIKNGSSLRNPVKNFQIKGL